MKAFAIKCRIPAHENSPVRNFGTIANSEQEAHENLMWHYRNYPRVNVGTTTLMPLRKAAISRITDGKQESLEVMAAIGQGFLFYITEDGEKFHKKCKLIPNREDPNHYVCKIWGDDHELLFDPQ